MKVELVGNSHLGFWCQGCQKKHMIRIQGDNSWQWNNDLERPSFYPSVFSTSGHYLNIHKEGESCWCTYKNGESEFKCTRCHLFVKDGEIIYLHDCSHDLKGQTVSLIDIPKDKLSS